MKQYITQQCPESEHAEHCKHYDMQGWNLRINIEKPLWPENEFCYMCIQCIIVVLTNNKIDYQMPQIPVRPPMKFIAAIG